MRPDDTFLKRPALLPGGATVHGATMLPVHAMRAVQGDGGCVILDFAVSGWRDQRVPNTMGWSAMQCLRGMHVREVQTPEVGTAVAVVSRESR